MFLEKNWLLDESTVFVFVFKDKNTCLSVGVYHFLSESAQLGNVCGLSVVTFFINIMRAEF